MFIYISFRVLHVWGFYFTAYYLLAEASSLSAYSSEQLRTFVLFFVLLIVEVLLFLFELLLLLLLYLSSLS